MEKQRIHEIGFQNNEEEIFVINDAEGDDNFAYGVELKSSNVNQGQLVTGKYNTDTNIDNYAVVVGGGSDELHRRNIYTLDKSGNATFGGTIKVNRNGNINEVATQEDLRNTAVGKFHTIDEPINVSVNLNQTGAGAIQTGGENVTIGLEPGSILPKAYGGTGRAIVDDDSSQHKILRGNMELIGSTGATAQGSPTTVLGWDSQNNLNVYPADSITSVASIPPNLQVRLDSTSGDLNANPPFIGIGPSGTLPVGRINFNSKGYTTNSITKNHKVPFFSATGGTEAGTSETVFIGLSTLKELLNVPTITTTTIVDCPNSTNLGAGKLGTDLSNNSYTSHSFNYSSYSSIENVLVTVWRKYGTKDYQHIFILTPNQEYTFSTKEYGLTDTEYTFKGKLDTTNKTVTLTFNPGAKVVVNCYIMATLKY